MADPLLTIAIPAYNAASTLPETLASLSAQTYRHFELVVVDNASTDRTPQVVEEWAARDPRMRLVRNASNIGGEANFNKCLQTGSAPLVALFHADDRYDPPMLERQVAFLESHPDHAAVFTRAAVFDGVRVTRHSPWPTNRVPPGGAMSLTFAELFPLVLRNGNAYLPTPSAMGRREAFLACGGFDFARFGSSADLGLWLAMSQRAPLGLLYEPLLRYRLGPHQGSFAINRARVGEADFFRVTEHFLAQTDGRMDGPTRRGYRTLRHEDAILRALNLARLGRGDEAGSLLAGVPGPETWALMLRRPAMRRLFATAWALRLALAMGQGEALARLVFRLRYGLQPEAPELAPPNDPVRGS